jgi:hypothetical protein
MNPIGREVELPKLLSRPILWLAHLPLLRSIDKKTGLTVVDPSKGVCADPVNGGAILGKGGTNPQRREQRASVEPGQGKG